MDSLNDHLTKTAPITMGQLLREVCNYHEEAASEYLVMMAQLDPNNPTFAIRYAKLQALHGEHANLYQTYKKWSENQLSTQ